MTAHEQDKMLDRIRRRLDQSTANLDGHTLQRLDEIRARALAREPIRESVNDGEESFLAAMRVSLDDSVSELEPDILFSLEQSRKAALAHLVTPASQSRRPRLEKLRRHFLDFISPARLAVPAGTLATVCVLAAAITLFYRMPDQTGSEIADADILLFASSDEIELYDNLDFYLWLADNGLSN